MLIHKLLSHCPDIGSLFLLVREKKGVRQERRLEEMKAHFLFRDIEEKIPGQLHKIKAVQGDVSQKGELRMSQIKGCSRSPQMHLSETDIDPVSVSVNTSKVLLV